MQTDDHGMDRRAVLAAAGGTLGGLAALATGLVDFTRAAEAEPTRHVGARRVLTEAEWYTLAAVQARILPTDDLGPGANEVNAIGYLDAVLADPGVSDAKKKRVRRGVIDLDRLARENWKKPRFVDLAPEAQDSVIKRYEQTPGADQQWEGRQWLRHMLGFTLEAFLGDPTHGVNPNGIGWAWLGNRPGEPRPETRGWKPKERR